MPTFAELKAKAANVTSAGVEKMQNIRDRNTSVPMAKTNWDPYSGDTPPPPPPPPPRTAVNLHTKPQINLPPPPSRTSASVSRSDPISSPPPPLPSRSTSSVTPPPPPSRIHSASVSPRPPFLAKPSSDAGPPPPIHRSTRPELKTRRATPAASEPEINWTNLSRQDKEVFFSWLDEFFKVKDASQTSDQSVHGTGSSTRSHVGSM